MTSVSSIVGRSVVVEIGGVAGVPAKVDTGADSSSVWASDISLHADGLHFKLFGPGSPYYTGEEMIVPEGQYVTKRIVSSTGGREERYAVELSVTLQDQTITASFSLADRLTLAYPLLLGCSFLAGRFLVDCAKQIPDELHQELLKQKQARRQAVGR